MKHETVMEVLQWARDNNVMRIKVGDVEAEFAPAGITPESGDLELQQFINSTLEDGQKTDEAQEQKERDEMMYYSS